MRTIPVYLRGRLATWTSVDDADWPILIQYLWKLNPEGYVYRSTKVEGTVRMHRQILGLTHGDGLEGDHVNGDPLDNQRSNLRVATHAENQQNRRSSGNRNGKAPRRGVSFCRQTGRWKATAVVDGTQHWLGRFDTWTEAAHAVSEFRAAHMPFAVETPTEEVALA